MPIRIYALAKQLKLDSKFLVDICEQAGVTGKGSALASLTDDEVETIKTYVSGGKAAKAAAAPTTVPPSGGELRREDYAAPGVGMGKVPVMTGPEPTSPPAPPEEISEAVQPAAAKASEEETPPSEASPPSVEPTVSAEQEPPVDPNAPVRPQFPSTPQSPTRMPVINGMNGMNGTKPAKPGTAAKPTSPTIKLAPMPTAH